MQAILLSAGRGQRLAPLTDTVPKPLVRVGQRALIDYQLEKLAAAGIKEVVINSGWLGQKVIEHVGTGQKYGLRVHYSVEPQVALETAGGIIQALSLIDDEPFIVCNADVFHEFNFSDLSEIKLTEFQAHLVLINNPEHNREGDFILGSGRITNKKKSKSNVLTLTYSGIGLYKKSFFSGLERGRRGLGQLLRLKAEAGYVTGQHFSGTWFDAGTQERLHEIEKHIASEK